MVDIFTHQILDMIDSRDYETVCEWLKTYPNLRVISRDGSVTYNNAITNAHPRALQISDRFHLLKNLTSYVTEYLKKRLKPQVSIQAVSQEIKEVKTIKQADENRKLTLKEKYEKIKQLLLEGRRKTEICRSLNMDIRAYDKLMAMTPKEREKSFQTKNMIMHEEKVKQKMERVKEVRELKGIGLSNREISKRTGLHRKTVRRYLDENFNPVHAAYGKKRNGKLTPYMKAIDEYLEKGVMGSYIEEKIREMGYEGSSSTVRDYIADWKKRRKRYYDRSREDGTKTETIKRENILKLLYHPIEKVKKISEKQFEMICKEYPFFEKIYKVTWEFKSMLTEKNINALDKWMERARNLNILEINSFINGIERDMEAVRNAIKYEYSNGLVEGCINKLKVIKRIMYGRCSFETLKMKTLRLEKMKLFN
jgi:transposase